MLRLDFVSFTLSVGDVGYFQARQAERHVGLPASDPLPGPGSREGHAGAQHEARAHGRGGYIYIYI